jgi:hypothetical protein
MYFLALIDRIDRKDLGGAGNLRTMGRLLSEATGIQPGAHVNATASLVWIAAVEESDERRGRHVRLFRFHETTRRPAPRAHRGIDATNCLLGYKEAGGAGA